MNNIKKYLINLIKLSIFGNIGVMIFFSSISILELLFSTFYSYF